MVKNLPASTGDSRFNPWVRKIPWRRKWQPTTVFLPGKAHGQRSLVCYSPWGHRVENNFVTKQQHQQNFFKKMNISPFGLLLTPKYMYFPLWMSCLPPWFFFFFFQFSECWALFIPPWFFDGDMSHVQWSISSGTWWHSHGSLSTSLAYGPNSQAQENYLHFILYEIGSSRKLGWALRSEYYSTLGMELCLGFSAVAEAAGRLASLWVAVGSLPFSLGA